MVDETKLDEAWEAIKAADKLALDYTDVDKDVSPDPLAKALAKADQKLKQADSRNLPAMSVDEFKDRITTADGDVDREGTHGTIEDMKTMCRELSPPTEQELDDAMDALQNRRTRDR